MTAGTEPLRPAAARGRRRAAGGGDPPSRKQALIEAAIALFARRPYRDVSVDEIVERAGVAHGMVSYHFSGKRGLFSATVSSIWEDLIAFESRSAQESRPDQAVRGYLHRNFEYVARYPDRYAILFQAQRDNGDIRQIIEEARVGRLAELVTAAGCRTDLPGALVPVMRAWNAYVEQILLEWSRHEVDRDASVELCVQVLVASLQALDGVRFDEQTELRALSRVAESREPG